jgi:hypothetical protein
MVLAEWHKKDEQKHLSASGTICSLANNQIY